MSTFQLVKGRSRSDFSSRSRSPLVFGIPSHNSQGRRPHCTHTNNTTLSQHTRKPKTRKREKRHDARRSPRSTARVVGAPQLSVLAASVYCKTRLPSSRNEPQNCILYLAVPSSPLPPWDSQPHDDTIGCAPTIAPPQRHTCACTQPRAIGRYQLIGSARVDSSSCSRRRAPTSKWGATHGSSPPRRRPTRERASGARGRAG